MQAPKIIVIDNFYANPYRVRDIALQQEYYEDLRHFKGKRTRANLLWPNLKEFFESILHKRIVDWLDQPCNGVFQITDPSNPLVYHSDSQDYAAAVYLNPDDDFNTNGTSFWEHKESELQYSMASPFSIGKTYPENISFLDEQQYRLLDRVGGRFNRLVIWNARAIHSATAYHRERLVQLFFFNVV